MNSIFLLECKCYNLIRKIYLPDWEISLYYFENILSSDDSMVMNNLGKFIYFAFKERKLILSSTWWFKCALNLYIRIYFFISIIVCMIWEKFLDQINELELDMCTGDINENTYHSRLWKEDRPIKPSRIKVWFPLLIFP